MTTHLVLPHARGTGTPDTSAQLIAKLRLVDGAGSGLDADTLDGLAGEALQEQISGLQAQITAIVNSGAPVGNATSLSTQTVDKFQLLEDPTLSAGLYGHGAGQYPVLRYVAPSAVPLLGGAIRRIRYNLVLPGIAAMPFKVEVEGSIFGQPASGGGHLHMVWQGRIPAMSDEVVASFCRPVTGWKRVVTAAGFNLTLASGILVCWFEASNYIPAFKATGRRHSFGAGATGAGASLQFTEVGVAYDA